MDHCTDHRTAEDCQPGRDRFTREELLNMLSDRDRLMDVSNVCIIKIRLADYTLVEYNDAMCRMIGCSREDYERRFHRRMAEYFTGGDRAALEKLQKAVERPWPPEKAAFPGLGMPIAKGSVWIGVPPPSRDRPETGPPGFCVCGLPRRYRRW